MGLITSIIALVKPTPVVEVIPVKLPMEKVFCEEHKLSIVIHKYNEKTLFTDDNAKSVVILTDENGSRYLKRYLLDGCNENCQTIQRLLKLKVKD